ncbi:small ribosomal subunit protein mS29-like [Amphiura filiformis]|uniref:small ribosomal subunit protein mS29-like n=1 Tax=Amphiura filiformis TaxID=82378 RepID=UPI003B21E688
MAAPMRVFSRKGITWHCRRAAHQQSKAKYVAHTQRYCTSTSEAESKSTDSVAAPGTFKQDFFRATENDPTNQTLKHEGQFYSIPLDQVKSILPVGTSTKWQRLIQPFQEASIMVRRPALEVINYLKQADYTNPPVKYALYGKKGSGKTMSLSHIIHYCHSQGWLIVHLPDASQMNYKFKFDYIDNYSYKDSTPYECMYDQPVYAAEWLAHFKQRNHKFLSEITTTEAYVWSKRETTEKGEPLLDVVNQGLKRPKNSCDAIGVILKELEHHSMSGKNRILFAVKTVNGLFAPLTNIRKPGGYVIPVAELTLNMHFKNFLRGNWTNGAMVMTVDSQNTRNQPNHDFKPLHLLQKEGFEFLDPFVPIFVDNYNEKEMESCIEFYRHKRWIENDTVVTEDGRKQLKFLTENSPGLLTMMSPTM